MRAYFATKLSPNISETPNGFLICKNVPIARTGEQEYFGYELDLQDERRDEVVIVTREENEVFSPETLASFEGTIFTDEHPSEEVTTQNVQYLQRGFVKDVRRGSDADADKILADIIVTDPVIIGKIVNDGKREISCGYKCEYVEQDGKIYQKNIRGNHVALVDSGRAGKDVAIKDSAVKPDRRKESFFMKTKNAKRQSLLSKFMGIVTHDADPDVVGEIVEELVSGGTDEEPAPAPEKKEEPAPAPAPEKEESKDEDVMTVLKSIVERLDKIEAAANKGTDDDPLAELEKEVEAAAGAENAEKPVEEMDEGEEAADEETSDEGGAALDEAESCDEETTDEKTSDEEAPQTSSTGDKAAIKAAIRDAKKAVAGIKDPKQKKAVADSMAKIIRQSYGIKPTTPKNSYAAINAVKTKKARTADSSKEINLAARQSAYDARNPHIKKK
ncbi:MAG: DUF2213 domain-containing protein [Eubacterium sp.]|nr:DUF2213 domain-containing protein [Eubacterium sp.]